MIEDIIKQAENGTFYFRTSFGFNPITGKRIQKQRSGFKTKKDAKKAYVELLKLDNTEETKVELNEMNFETYTKEVFLPWYKTQVKERTYENRESAVKKHFAYFYNKNINQIEPLDVQTWQVELSKKLSSQYIRSVQGLFSIAMDRAIVLNLAETNPSKIVGNVKKRKTKIDFWTKEEFESVISKLYIDDYYQHYLFISLWLLFMTGMRIGEAQALQWDDIDFDTGILNIDKTLYYKNAKEFYLTEPKTKASIRQIAIDDVTLNYLLNWKKVQSSVISTNWILSYNEIPTNKHAMAYAITRFSKLAGVHRIRVHALRHSHASLLISMGENALVIKDRLGHEDIETTLGTYGHLYPNSNMDVAKKLNGKITFNPSQSNYDHSPKNQHTAIYS